MYLSRLYIKNFRSIKELDLGFSKGKNVIVGRNNAGKSNIIKAIDLVLGENAPAYQKSDNLTDNDFYCWKQIIDEEEIICQEKDLFIWCELTREVNEALNYDELYKCFGYYVYSEKTVYNQSRVKPIDHILLPSEYESIFAISEDDNQGRMYVNPKKRNEQVLEYALKDMFCFAFGFRAQRDQDGKITKEIRLFYRKNDQSNWTMTFRASIRSELLQSAIIPPFRDPQSQLRLSSWSWYGKLMRSLTDGYVKDEEFRNAVVTVNAVANKIFDQVNTIIQSSSLNIAFPGTQISFQFNAENRTDLYKSCVIYVDDGFKSQLFEKGSGIQSALIIGLFNYYTKYVNTVSSALLCIEEPEIYLHLHARRVINNRLEDFLDGNRNQVILTTHCVEFINTTKDDLSIILVQKTESQTTAQAIHNRQFKHLLINNNQNEIFFADKVILCEGLDDYIIKAIAEEICPGLLDEQNISIIAVGGKDQLAEMAQLILKLKIKSFLLADFDYLLRDEREERKNYGANIPAHKSIMNLGAAFFNQECIFGADGGKQIGRLQKCRNYLINNFERQFYTAKTVDEFEHGIFNDILKSLRQNGICLLHGEIENYCTDETFLRPVSKKLELDSIYDLNKRLQSGQRMSELFDIAEIAEFLHVVFDR